MEEFREMIAVTISRDDCSHRGLKWSAVAIGLDVEPDPHFEPAEGRIVSISVFFKTTTKNTINWQQILGEKEPVAEACNGPKTLEMCAVSQESGPHRRPDNDHDINRNNIS